MASHAAVSAVSLPTEARDRITSAAPQRAMIAPRQPRRLLVYTHAQGFIHESIPYGAFALSEMGRKTGAFTATVSDDPAMFEPEALKNFDAIALMSTTGNFLLPRDFVKLDHDTQVRFMVAHNRRQAALERFVLEGKGLVGIHAATDCMYEWPAFGEIIGGYFNEHPWHEKVAIRVVEPTHCLVAPLEGDFTITDEIYQFKAPYSLSRLRELLALDTSKTDMRKPNIHRTDGDFAVAWVRKAGAGRVFYSSLGHRPEIFWNARLMRFYLAGTQYALGDLPAEDTPSRP
jgi:type 1 glutamine amidotransferase